MLFHRTLAQGRPHRAAVRAPDWAALLRQKGRRNPGLTALAIAAACPYNCSGAWPQPTLSKKPLMFRMPTAGASQGNSGWVVCAFLAGSWVATTAGAWC